MENAEQMRNLMGGQSPQDVMKFMSAMQAMAQQQRAQGHGIGDMMNSGGQGHMGGQAHMGGQGHMQGQSPQDVMKFVTAMQAMAQQQREQREQGHGTADMVPGQGHVGGHSHGPDQAPNRSAMMQIMQEKFKEYAAKKSGSEEKPCDDRLLTSRKAADVEFEGSVGHNLSHMNQQYVKANIPQGYVLQDPHASIGPQNSFLSGGGHYTPPVFGWGSVAKGFEDPMKSQGRPERVVSFPANPMDQMMFGEPAAKLNNFYLRTLPLLGRVRFVKDIAGYIQSFIVLLYWIYGNWSTWTVILLPHYYDGQLSILSLLIYAVISLLCLVSFFKAVTTSPGTTPRDSPGSQPDAWTFCKACNKTRPPSAHHCRRCGQCVPRMDHHCPWINNCVGEDNQWLFMQLVAYAYLLSLATLVFDLLHLYYLPPCVSCDPMSFTQRYAKPLITVAIIKAVLMMCGGGGLYCTQHLNVVVMAFTYRHAKPLLIVAMVKAVLMMCGGGSLYLTQHMYVTTETSTLDWMKIQQDMHASGRYMDRDKLPKQKLPMKETYSRVCGAGPWWLWPLPCRKRRPALTLPTNHSV